MESSTLCSGQPDYRCLWPLSEVTYQSADPVSKRSAISRQFRIYFDQLADAKGPELRLLDKLAD